MGSTFINYKGRGFEANDSAIEVLLKLLVEEIDKIGEAPGWMREMRDDWDLQATAGFGFGVMPGLDQFIIDDSRRTTVIDLARRTLSKLESWGDPVPRETLNSLHTGGEGASFGGDVPAGLFLRTARYFIKLLEGTLEPWETDARFEQQP
jgi:hypothetical protein